MDAFPQQRCKYSLFFTICNALLANIYFFRAKNGEFLYLSAKTGPIFCGYNTKWGNDLML